MERKPNNALEAPAEVERASDAWSEKKDERRTKRSGVQCREDGKVEAGEGGNGITLDIHLEPRRVN